MNQHHIILILNTASICSAVLALLSFLFIALPEHKEVKETLAKHVEESHQVHLVMEAFMSSGPRFSKSDGLKMCDVVNSFYAEQGLPTPLECK